MRRGTAAAAACTALLATGLAACGDQPAPVSAAPEPRATPGRAELLATCPAQASPWVHGRFGDPANTDDPEVLRVAELVNRAATVAERYLAELPADQVGELRVDPARTAVIVQVTRDADVVGRELQQRLGDDVRGEVETVRYPKAELERASATIRDLPGLEWSGVGMSGNGRFDVEVVEAEAIPAAKALIAKSVDPCMFTVTQGGPVVPLPATVTVAP
jgi:hypothetical protein